MLKLNIPERRWMAGEHFVIKSVSTRGSTCFFIYSAQGHSKKLIWLNQSSELQCSIYSNMSERHRSISQYELPDTGFTMWSLSVQSYEWNLALSMMICCFIHVVKYNPLCISHERLCYDQSGFSMSSFSEASHGQSSHYVDIVKNKEINVVQCGPGSVTPTSNMTEILQDQIQFNW